MSGLGVGGGGGSSRKKPPSGVVNMVVPGDRKDPTGPVQSCEAPSLLNQPMPVILTLGTILKLASIITIPMIGLLSTGLYFFHKTNIHLEDSTIHLGRSERAKLETKAEANEARSKLAKSISRELSIQTRELKQDLGDQQARQYKKLCKEIRSDQKKRFDVILNEVRQSRRGFHK